MRNAQYSNNLNIEQKFKLFDMNSQPNRKQRVFFCCFGRTLFSVLNIVDAQDGRSQKVFSADETEEAYQGVHIFVLPAKGRHGQPHVHHGLVDKVKCHIQTYIRQGTFARSYSMQFYCLFCHLRCSEVVKMEVIILPRKRHCRGLGALFIVRQT